MMPAKEILIVDDEVGIRELLSEILQDEGYRVSVAENATAARAYRAREQPALVLLDIWMPDTDGVTLLREWAAAGLLTMPVIMMSGHGTIETAVEATKIGAFDFLEKPVGLQKLLGTVARALKIAFAREPRRVSLAAIGTSAAVRDVERQMEQLLAARKPLLILGEPWRAEFINLFGFFVALRMTHKYVHLLIRENWCNSWRFKLLPERNKFRSP